MSTAKAVRGNPQPPVRIKFETYLTPSYTEAGVSYTQNVREMSCTCPHHQKGLERGKQILCKHLQNAVVAAHFEAIDIARTVPSSHLAQLSLKYHQFPHLRDACLFVLWERERETDAALPGFAEFQDKIAQLEGEMREFIEERQTVAAPNCFSESINQDAANREDEKEDAIALFAQVANPDPRVSVIDEQITALEGEIGSLPYCGKNDTRILNRLYEKLDRLQARRKYLLAERAINTGSRTPEDEAALKELFR
jgi:hypothetical protein